MQPHAPELEEAVIGACLIEQEALPLIEIGRAHV